MFAEKGTISINTENIFPLIKKSLYSNTEIFIRELASNGVDACQKLNKLSNAGQAQLGEGGLFVNVLVDEETRTIVFEDNGIGMTKEEVEKYINQIAFSGAADFLEKHAQVEGKKEDFIGNFGLGFYSAFMVADRVELETKSYQADAVPVKWTCDGSTQFEFSPSEKEGRGTRITLFLSADSDEFASKSRVQEVLTKYCRFLLIEIQFEGERINNVASWTKAPSELTDEDYKAFYKTLYPYAEDPLFWIHLNVDYPFNLTGILFFPKVENKLELEREKIQLYSRQVFITEDVKDIVPDFLMMLHGVIDSPDIPLNISRNALQADSNVRKISNHIVKKVADKLAELYNNDRADFEMKWSALSFFVKYGYVSEPKFKDKANAFMLLQNTEGKLFSLDEYKTHIEEKQTDKDGTLNYLYTNNREKQITYLQAVKGQGYDVLVMDHIIDPHFINAFEQSLEKSTFKRVDSAPAADLITKDETRLDALGEEEKEQAKEAIKTAAPGGAQVEAKALTVTDMPVLVTKNEFMSRMEEMSKVGAGGFMGGLPETTQLIINTNHPAIGKLLAMPVDERPAYANYLVNLALLGAGNLKGERITEFMKQALAFAS